jgi:hypothetical protein
MMAADGTWPGTIAVRHLDLLGCMTPPDLLGCMTPPVGLSVDGRWTQEPKRGGRGHWNRTLISDGSCYHCAHPSGPVAFINTIYVDPFSASNCQRLHCLIAVYTVGSMD